MDCNQLFFALYYFLECVLTEMLVMDADDPAPPLPPADWVFPIVTHQDLLDAALARIPEFIASTRGGTASDLHPPDHSAPTAALRVCQLALAETGGQLILMTSCHPKKGYGKSKIRENNALYNTEGELILYGSLDVVLGLTKVQEEKDTLKLYMELKEECVKSNICVNVFFAADNEEFKVCVLCILLT